MHFTIALYSTRQFIRTIFVIYAVVISTFSIIDLIEIIRRTSTHNPTTLQIISHTALQIPFVIQETFIFVIFAASIYTFLRMSKNNEYTIIKSSGVSIWQFLSPFILVTIVSSIFVLTVINPISAHFLIKQQRVLDNILSGTTRNPSAIFESGFWLIDDLPFVEKSLIINVNTIIIDKNQTSLLKASVIEVDRNFQLIRTLEAQEMILKDGYWNLKNVTEYIAKKPKTYHDLIEIPTKITNSKLESNFKRPDLVSIWELPYFMHTLKATGHSAKSYIVYFYKLFTKPFLATSLLFIAASFTLHPIRLAKLSRAITLCVISGFIMYLSVEITYSLGADYMTSLMSMLALIFIMLSIGIFRLHKSKV
jgi:lipopolysaccharide export system permease protein